SVSGIDEGYWGIRPQDNRNFIVYTDALWASHTPTRVVPHGDRTDCRVYRHNLSLAREVANLRLITHFNRALNYLAIRVGNSINQWFCVNDMPEGIKVIEKRLRIGSHQMRRLNGFSFRINVLVTNCDVVRKHVRGVVRLRFVSIKANAVLTPSLVEAIQASNPLPIMKNAV